MRCGYSVERVRAAERELMARLPDGALMQRAAAGLAAACARMLGRTYGRRVVLLAGSGDNGGDALYAGARLARRGASVVAVAVSPGKEHAGGARALRDAGGRIAERGTEAAGAALTGADLVVDGIVGIGGRGGLRPEAEELMRLVEESGAPVVSVDLPSGVDADTGEVTGPAVTADATVTFGTYKPGLLIDPAHEHAGALRLVDIGLHMTGEPDVEALQHADLARLLPRPASETNKYRRGVIGIVAGSGKYPGAAVLAVAGALRGGAGAVRYVGPGARAVIDRFPETLVSEGQPAEAGRVQAWAVGSGIGDGSEARRALEQVLESDVPVLVDADGLHLMDPVVVRARSAPTLLTPHAGEAAALLGRSREEVESRRLESARELAGQTGSVVLLKGTTTLVAESGRSVRVNPTGTGRLATAGTGDILSGLAGSLLAAGLEARDAASAAAYLHGLAGRFAPFPPGASDVGEHLTRAWQDVME